MRRTFAALALLLSVPMALAQVYKWTDASGTVHYSETPPARGSYKTLRASGSAQALAPASAASSPPAPTQAGTATGNAANPSKLCEDLQRNMNLLQGTDALSVTDANGAQVPMDAPRRAQELALAQAQFKLYCTK
ncbi:MAG: DUF4124 domain-containing protein [Dyella sp.]